MPGARKSTGTGLGQAQGQLPDRRLALRLALPDRLIKQHPGRHRDIEALDRPQLRQPHHEIAGLAGQLAQPRPLGAQHQHHPALQVHLVGQLRAVGVGADHPQARFLQQLQRAREIGHRDDRRRFGRARRHLAGSGIELRGAILRHDHGERAASIGGAQAGAEVVRILHAIEHEQHRILSPFSSAVSRSSSVHGGSGSTSAMTP